MRAFSHQALGLAAALCAVAIAPACGGGSGTTQAGSGGGAPVNGGTLLAGIPANPDHLDGALSATTEGWEILEATNDGLLTFRRAAGGAGSQVVPDLATAMPKITGGGRVYTFHLRLGRAVLAAGQPGGAALRRQVVDRAHPQGELAERQLVHRDRRRNGV